MALKQINLFDIPEKISKGQYKFEDSFPISKKSTFNSDIYDWTDNTNPDLIATSEAKIIINWSKYTIGTKESENIRLNNQEFIPLLPKQIIEEIKIFTCIYSSFPDLFMKKNFAKKAVTVVKNLKTIINFISYIYFYNYKKYGYQNIIFLKDIRISDIKEALNSYPYSKKDIKNVLILLCKPFVNINFKHGKVPWNEHDIKTLKLIHKAVKRPNLSSYFPDELFSLFSEKSIELIKNFLKIFDIESNDKLNENINFFIQDKCPNFKKIFDDQVRCQGGFIQDNWSNSKLGIKYSYEDVKNFHDVLLNIHVAAQVVILLYTGMRFSEVISLKKGCLVKENNYWFLKSRVIKSRISSTTNNMDKWIAVDIVIDSIRVLEKISEYNFNIYLFSSLKDSSSKENDSLKPITNVGLSTRINSYLNRIDKDSKWSEYTITLHQFRHTLVYQFSKAKIGLYFISRHLKHAYTNYSRLPSQTTVGYGNYISNLVDDITYSKIKKSYIKGMLDNSIKIVGPGEEKFKKRTEAFFTGSTSSQEDRDYDKLADKLLASGVSLIPTGLGICTLNRSNKKELIENPPACMGDYQCKPDICKNAVITKDSIPSIKLRLKDALYKSNLPEYQHVKTHFDKVVDYCNKVLSTIEK